MRLLSVVVGWFEEEEEVEEGSCVPASAAHGTKKIDAWMNLQQGVNNTDGTHYWATHIASIPEGVC